MDGTVLYAVGILLVYRIIIELLWYRCHMHGRLYTYTQAWEKGLLTTTRLSAARADNYCRLPMRLTSAALCLSVIVLAGATSDSAVLRLAPGPSSSVLASSDDGVLRIEAQSGINLACASGHVTINSTFYSRAPPPTEGTSFDLGGGTEEERAALDVRGVLPVGWLAHPSSTYNPLRGSIFELSEEEALAAGVRYAYGHRSYTSAVLGHAGHWGVSRWFSLSGPGGKLRATATAKPGAGGDGCCSASRSCGTPTSARFTDIAREQWLCEDDAFIQFEFFDAENAPIAVDAVTAYSRSLSHQAAGQWTYADASVGYVPERAGLDLSQTFWPLRHGADVPEAAVSVRVTLVGTDGTHTVKPLGYRGANAGIAFGRLDVGYDRGIEVEPSAVASLRGQLAAVQANLSSVHASLAAVQATLSSPLPTEGLPPSVYVITASSLDEQDTSRADVRAVMPAGWYAHPVGTNYPAINGLIYTLTDAEARLARSRHAYGFRHYCNSGNSLGCAGYWGLSKYFTVQAGSGTLRLKAYAWSSSCSVPETAEFTDLSSQSWYCEDEADLRVEFFDSRGVEVSAAPAVKYSKTFSHQLGGPWVLVSGNTYRSTNPGSYTGVWRSFTHEAAAPASTAYVRVTMFGTDATNSVRSVGFNTPNAGVMFSRLELSYNYGFHERSPPMA